MADWFKDFENYPIVDKAKINWPYTLDFEVQSKYIVSDIKRLLKEVKTASDTELLKISQHCFNLLSWVRQMNIMGFHSLETYLNNVLIEEFGNKNVINNLQKEIFNRWVNNKSGQYYIGVNWYNILHGKIYYRKLTGEWFLVEKGVFDVAPKLGISPNPETTSALEKDYTPTKYDKVFQEWKRNNYSNNFPIDLDDCVIGETSPENNFQHSMKKIKSILSSPVAIDLLEKEFNNLNHLEYMIKVSLIMVEYAQQRRESKEHTVYLLRDCLIFYELQNTLDILDGQETSSDQLYIGRKIMSNKKREGGHWYFTQEVLFQCCLESPSSFEEFYKEYTKLLDEYTEYSQEFALFVKDIFIYIEKHIESAMPNNLKVTIVDLGFQGSINMFIKYVIDKYYQHKPKLKTDIEMYVLAEWFKDIYGSKRYVSDTYSLLTHIEVLARNELLYEYNVDSLKDGNISIVMGSKEDQRNANIELIITTMVALISNNLGLLK